MKKCVAAITVLVMALTLSAGSLMAQGGNASPGMKQIKKAPPFLIAGKMPHLTKLLMQQWDNPELKLTEGQKGKLLAIRKETLAGVRRLVGEIGPLEKQVAEGIFAGKTPDELSPTVLKIAQLKTEATMLHLQCIHKTKAVLDKQQLAFLLKTVPK